MVPFENRSNQMCALLGKLVLLSPTAQVSLANTLAWHALAWQVSEQSKFIAAIVLEL